MSGAHLVENTAPQIGGPASGERGIACGAGAGESQDPVPPACADNQAPCVLSGLDFLRLSPPPPPPEDEDDIDGIPVAEHELEEIDRTAVPAEDEVLVLDEVGVCEDVTVGARPTASTGGEDHSVDLQGKNIASQPGEDIEQNNAQQQGHKANSEPSEGHNEVKMENSRGLQTNEQNETRDGISAELNDDILSIICDDYEEDDFGDNANKREWRFESHLSSNKRKQDTPTGSPRLTGVKRSRSTSKSPPESGRLRVSSVHSRLGRSKYHPNGRENQKPCYHSRKDGSCSRASCQFLHPSPPPQDSSVVLNRRARAGNCDSSILGHPSVLELQQKAQEQQLQLEHQKAQQQLLVRHIQQTERHLKEYAANQAQQVYEHLQENFHHLRQQQQDQLNQIKEMFSDQLGRFQCKTEDHLRALMGRLQELESAEYTQQDILAHYQFIASFQRQQLQLFMRGRSGGSHERPTNQKCLDGPPWPQLPDLRQLPPLKKPDGRPPRPRSADLEDPRHPRDVFPPVYVKQEGSPRRPRSADNQHPSRTGCFTQGLHQVGLPLRHHDQLPVGEGGQHGWCLGPAFHNSPLMRSPHIPSDHPMYHAANSPRVVRVIPFRHCTDSMLGEYKL